MSGRSNKKSIEATLSSMTTTNAVASTKDEEDPVIQRKITLATEGFTTTKFCELVLKDRNRLSRENVLTVCNYIIAMKREVNPRLCTIKNTIQFLAELSKSVGVEKQFEDMTKEDILFYLDSNRESENVDPLHKWVGSYNVKRATLLRFFKWLYYPNVDTSKRRSELSAQERRPECIMGIPQIKSTMT